MLTKNVFNQQEHILYSGITEYLTKCHTKWYDPVFLI
jgi:hypothetical protein